MKLEKTFLKSLIENIRNVAFVAHVHGPTSQNPWSCLRGKKICLNPGQLFPRGSVPCTKVDLHIKTDSVTILRYNKILDSIIDGQGSIEFEIYLYFIYLAPISCQTFTKKI